MWRAKGSDLGQIVLDPGGIGHTVIQYINSGSEIVLPGRWGPKPMFVRDFLSQNLYNALRFTSVEGREAAYKHRFRASPPDTPPVILPVSGSPCVDSRMQCISQARVQTWANINVSPVGKSSMPDGDAIMPLNLYSECISPGSSHVEGQGIRFGSNCFQSRWERIHCYSLLIPVRRSFFRAVGAQHRCLYEVSSLKTCTPLRGLQVLRDVKPRINVDSGASPHMSVHPQLSGIEPQEYGFSSVHLAA